MHRADGRCMGLQRTLRPGTPVYGCVTNGEAWQFLRLVDSLPKSMSGGTTSTMSAGSCRCSEDLGQGGSEGYLAPSGPAPWSRSRPGLIGLRDGVAILGAVRRGDGAAWPSLAHGGISAAVGVEYQPWFRVDPADEAGMVLREAENPSPTTARPPSRSAEHVPRSRSCRRPPRSGAHGWSSGGIRPIARGRCSTGLSAAGPSRLSRCRTCPRRCGRSSTPSGRSSARGSPITTLCPTAPTSSSSSAATAAGSSAC